MAVVQYTISHKQDLEQHIQHQIGNSARRASSLRVIPWHLPHNWGKSREKPQNNDTQSDNDMLVPLLLCQWSKIKLNPIKVENTFCCACNSICTGEPWTTRLTRIFSICQWVCYGCISRTWSTRCGVWIYVLAWWTGYTPMLLWILRKVQCSQNMSTTCVK